MKHFFCKAIVRSIALIGVAAVCRNLSFAADLYGAFPSPQGSVRENTGPLFWMHGTETPEQLRKYVRIVAESGQGILTIESRPHVDWMRKGWWRDVDIVLDECRKAGIKMMIFDDYWWPSQGMGGKYPIPQEYRCRNVKANVYETNKAPEKVPNEICRVKAAAKGKGIFELGANGDKVIVYSWVTSKGGHLYHTVNGLDEAAVDWFLANYYQPYYDRYKKYFEDGTIKGFFFDEPVFRAWWGPALEKELMSRGENIGELLTALKFKHSDPQIQAKAYYRYLDARSVVWGRTMYGRQSEWCKRHGVFSSGHFVEHEQYYYGHIHAAGDVLQQMKYVYVPGVDLVCRQYYPNYRTKKIYQIKFGQLPKYASSVAHVYNRHNGLNWCEIFGAYGQDLTYPQMKWMCDWHQYQGCYFLIPHAFNPKSPKDKDCPPYFYNSGFEPRYPLFRVWADYNNRCAMMLSDGDHVCHIAQCVPGLSYHVGKTIRPEMLAFAIQDAQLDSDWIGYDVVSSAVIGKNPRTGRTALRAENGKEWYDILTLPATQYVPFDVLEKALAFAKAGGVVVGYGIKPCNTPTSGKRVKDVEEIVNSIFALPNALFIEGEPDGAELRAALAKNYPGTDKPLALRDFDFVGLSKEDGKMLAINHYVKDGAETIFIANQDTGRGRDLALWTRWPLEKAQLFDPMQGTVEKPIAENGLLKISLKASQALFLVWPGNDKNVSSALPFRVDEPSGEIVSSAVKEEVTPVKIKGKEYNLSDAFSYAGPRWIWHPVNPKSQGKVVFKSVIELSQAESADIIFSCDNEAFIYVNGKEVARQLAGADLNNWKKFTRTKIRFEKGKNEIKVVADNVIPGFAGFICNVVWSSGMLPTNSQLWEVSRNGGKPVRPKELGRYGAHPWGRLTANNNVTLGLVDESVSTTLTFKLPKLKSSERIFLSCDNVEGERSAAVSVNGAFAGGFIGAPYMLDITKSVKEGKNVLETKPFRLVNPRIIRQ